MRVAPQERLEGEHETKKVPGSDTISLCSSSWGRVPRTGSALEPQLQYQLAIHVPEPLTIATRTSSLLAVRQAFSSCAGSLVDARLG